MYVGERGTLRMEDGMIYGNLLATAKAMNGTYGTMAQLKEVMELPLSSKGLAFLSRVHSEKEFSDVVLVPSRYIEKPRYTIGLGDSFVAGMQICFG